MQCSGLILIVMLGSQAFVNAMFDASTYTHSKELHRHMTIHWRIDGDTLQLGVKATAKGWVGFGIAEAGGMKGADIVYYEAATNSLTDAYAVSESRPITDSCQDWTLLSGGIENDEIFFEATRALQTGDQQDWPIVNDAEGVAGMRYIAAWGNTYAMAPHSPHHRTHGSIRFHGDAKAADPLAAIRSDPSVSSFEIRVDKFMVPSGTFYHLDCYNIALEAGAPAHEPLHIVAFETIIQPGSEPFVHHFTASVFTSDLSQEAGKNSGGHHRQEAGCHGAGSMVFVWTPGAEALVLPEEAGFRILGPGLSPRSMRLQVHYNNPGNARGVEDSSGVRVYFSRQLRPHDVGSLNLGDPRDSMGGTALAGGVTKQAFACDGVTEAFEQEEVTIFYRLLHMHHLGERMVTRVLDRDGAVKREDAVEYWDYHTSGGHFPPSTGAGIKLARGDRLHTECYYRTEGPVQFGLGTDDEMCIDFIFYYPKQPIGNDGVCGPSKYGKFLGQTRLPSIDDIDRGFGLPCGPQAATATLLAAAVEGQHLAMVGGDEAWPQQQATGETDGDAAAVGAVGAAESEAEAESSSSHVTYSWQLSVLPALLLAVGLR